MEKELLASRANPKIREAAALLDAAARKKTGRFLLEGARLCADAADSGVPVEAAFVTPAAEAKFPAACGRLLAAARNAYSISEQAAEKLSDTRSPQGVFCVCLQREPAFSFRADGFYVLTDGVQNPDNLGAVSRTAEALGAAGLIVGGGCDVYAPKALRASMGALLRLPVLRTDDPAGTVLSMRRQGFTVYAAALRDDAVDVRAAKKGAGTAVVIGNEGNGVSPAVSDACDASVVIPMPGGAESLNAAAAAAILIWEFTKDIVR